MTRHLPGQESARRSGTQVWNIHRGTNGLECPTLLSSGISLSCLFGSVQVNRPSCSVLNMPVSVLLSVIIIMFLGKDISINLSPTRSDSATYVQEMVGRIFSPRRHEEKGFGAAGLRRAFSYPWHAFFPMCCTRRREGAEEVGMQGQLAPSLDCGRGEPWSQNASYPIIFFVPCLSSW